MFNTRGGSVTVTLHSKPYKLITLPNGSQRITMEDFAVNASPGDPFLPLKVFSIALPPQADFSTISLQIDDIDITELPGVYEIAPCPPVAISLERSTLVSWGKGKRIVDGRNMNVYGLDERFPDSAVRLLPYSQMRKWKFSKVEFYPFQYNPVSKKLYHIRSVTITLDDGNPTFQARALNTFTPAELVTLKDTVMNDVAAETIYNFDEALPWFSPPQGSVSKGGGEPAPGAAPGDVTNNYVIITTATTTNNLNMLSTFVTHLENLGHSVKIVTENDYGSLTGQAPNGTAEKIREWLKQNYLSMGIEYVLLIGNPDPGSGDIPMKMCWPRYDPSYPDSPTDYFYADLTGNWDLDGDQDFGEYNGDSGDGGVDFTPEVYVGRIPLYGSDYTGADAILEKTISYELASTNISWRKKMLMPMAVSNYENEDYYGYDKTDGRNLPKAVITNYLTASGFSHYVFYEKAGLDPVPDSADYDNPSHTGISKSAVISEWTNGYGCVFWWGHGSQTAAYRKYWASDDGDGVPESGEMMWTIFCESGDTAQLNDNMPSIVYACSCLNGYPENSGNLGYSLLRRGAVATISASRVSWYLVGTWNPASSPDNASIGYYIFQRLIKLDEPVGKANLLAKSALPDPAGWAWQNKMDFNLYGSPSLGLSSNNVLSHTLSVTSAHGMASPSVGQHTYPDGSYLTCMITNSPLYEGNMTTQYVCVGWAGTGCVTNGLGTNTTFVLTNDSTISWNWSTQFMLNATAGPGGTVTATNGWYDAGATGVAVTANASNYHTFDGWSGDVPPAETNNPSLSLTMDQARTILANFDPFTYTITASAGANGNILPSGAIEVVHGSNATFTITPDLHYCVNDVLIDSISIGVTESYTFVNIVTNHTIHADFTLDTEPGSLQFSSAGYSVSEGAGTVSLTVSRTGGSYGTAQVSYVTHNLTALAGSDYTAVSGTLAWANWDAASKLITITISDDAYVESNETFQVSLTNAAGATLGAPASATVTIADNDNPSSGSVQFGAANYAVNEDDETVQVAVTRTGGNYGQVSVNYATHDGTAVAGSDYTTGSGTLFWSDSDSLTRFITVFLTDDKIQEGYESFSVTLTDALGASLGSPANAIVTISDIYSSDDTNDTAMIVTCALGGPGFYPVSGDYDGDNKTDLTIYHEQTGWWYILLSKTWSVGCVRFGGTGYEPVSGDYDGDGKTDLAIYNEQTGWWYIALSSDWSLGSLKLGASDYIPVSADYDGDGKTDLAVYHKITGWWYILLSEDWSFAYTQFGASGYTPVPADFDRDGKAELAVYHQQSGWWYLIYSDSWSLASAKLGEEGYIPVSGDYDGDGKMDIAVYQRNLGYWYVLLSDTGKLVFHKLGGTGYQPVPGDFNGDGITDPAVYHESSGYWFLSL